MIKTKYTLQAYRGLDTGVPCADGSVQEPWLRLTLTKGKLNYNTHTQKSYIYIYVILKVYLRWSKRSQPGEALELKIL